MNNLYFPKGEEMNSLERFKETVCFGKPDRPFLRPQWFFKETVKRWQKEGMPADVHVNTYFGFDRIEIPPIRYPEYWDEWKRCVKDRDYPLGISAGSFYGWVRNWMGMEKCDNPELVKEVINYISDFVCKTIEKAVSEVKFDFALIWEDLEMKNKDFNFTRFIQKILSSRLQKGNRFS